MVVGARRPRNRLTSLMRWLSSRFHRHFTECSSWAASQIGNFRLWRRSARANRFSLVETVGATQGPVVSIARHVCGMHTGSLRPLKKDLGTGEMHDQL
jgi:hypothetical protein